MENADGVLLKLIINICLYIAISISSLFFIAQGLKYQRFMKNRVGEQDLFIRRSIKIMIIAYIISFVMTTYTIILTICSTYIKDV